MFDEIQELQAQDAPWFAVHTRYQHEPQVNEQLIGKGFETFYPTCLQTRVWTDRKKTISAALFPGYLFISLLGDRRLHVLSTPGVCGIVGVAGMPAAISGDEIAAIRRAVESSRDVQPHAYLKAGDQVRVCEGPLAGLVGILVRNDRSSRLVLSIDLLGRSVSVEMDGDSVAPAAASHTAAVFAAASAR